jgi:Ion channel
MTSRLWKRARFWEKEYSLTALLIMLVVTLFVVMPLASSAILGSEIMLCFVAGLTVTGVAAVSGRRSMTIIVMLLAVSGIGVDWFAHYEQQIGLFVLDDLLRLAFVLMLAVIVTSQVLRPGSVTHHRVQGGYLRLSARAAMLGLFFRYSFLLDRSAFRATELGSTAPVRTGIFRYFSFVTLTTLGYGDILPVSPIARALSTSEALFWTALSGGHDCASHKPGRIESWTAYSGGPEHCEANQS